MQTLFKILPILLAMFLAQPVVAQDNYAQLIFYYSSNIDKASDKVNKPTRRSPSRVPALPACYFDGDTITFTTDNDELVLPYSIIDVNGIAVASGTITVAPEMSSIIDVSMLPAGYYQLVVGFDQNCYACFYRE